MFKCSIITICRNAEKEIGKTIESVLKQKIDLSQIEMVVVDGLSEDNTQQVVASYKEKAEKLGLKMFFKSEKDDGIYDAMNKGATRAQGEWCLYLNAGDVLFNEASLSHLMSNANPEYDIVYGDAMHCYKNRGLLVKASEKEKLTYKKGMEFCHQSCIIKKALLQKNPYTQKYKIAGDYEFFTRVFLNGARFHYVPETIAVFDREGVSSTNGARVVLENAMVQFEYNLITEDEYNKKKTSAEKTLELRNKTPKILVNIRHRLIMEKSTRNWIDLGK